MTTLRVLDIFNHLETNVVWVIQNGGTVVACLFGTHKGDAFYLSKLSVHPGARGSGLAAQLMATAQVYAMDHGYRYLDVIARVELTQNHAMFKKLGYEKFAEGRHPGYDRTTEIHFRKPI